LQRAIDSLRHQTAGRVQIVIVANGARVDATLLERLKQAPDLQVIHQVQGGVTRAQQTGREAINTEFFGFLDDDDEYLSDAVALRASMLAADPSIDFVASNGYRHRKGADELLISGSLDVQSRPLHTLGHTNWLASCGGLFRSSSVGPEFFKAEVTHLEWTHLAYALLSHHKRMAFLDRPTFRIHDTPRSLSKSLAYRQGVLQALHRIRAMPLPGQVRKRVSLKLGAAHHELAEHCLKELQGSLAWRHHMDSLFTPGGIRYLSFTRHLLRQIPRFLRSR